MGELSFVFTYSFIYLYQYGLIDIYFILWVLIQYNLIFFFFAPIVPPLVIGSSFTWLPDFLTQEKNTPK